ncbi:MAG TPA: DUF1549 and DUF1553 domain-containing protein [Planctomycetaceae bacterium]|nr:DUF1549 and DUF1553 domain-containing protein [Planctomycetaceae bacterium]
MPLLGHHRVLFAGLCLGLIAVPAAAAELLSPELSIPEVIDRLIGDELAHRQIVPASRTDDATLLRRTTLDLAGRIPTVAEQDDFAAMSPSEKRERLVDRLLASPDFAWHLKNEWDALLMPPRDGNGEWRDYLLQSARENRPWDRMFSDMLAAKEDDPQNRGALQFVKARTKELDQLTNDTSALFFGVSINCAKCHDHPLVDDWKQDHYFGISSFFARTYVTKGKRLADKATAEVKFTTTKGVEKQARLMFLTGAEIAEPVVELTSEQEKAAEEEVRRQQREDNVPAPAEPVFRPRWELVNLALQPENRGYFARSLVNRVWARLLGRGLVHPVDQMHSSNPASHPELLDWLERDAIAHGYDVQRLIRGIVLSDVYARSSQWTQPGEPPSAETFAVGIIRPLTPKQIAVSLPVASQAPTQFAAVLDAPNWSRQREQLENQANDFARQLEQPGEHFQVSVTEALLFSNSDRVQNEYLRDSDDRLVGVLKTQSDDDAVVIAFRSVLSRQPTADELDTFRRYLAPRSDRKPAAWQQALWALVTSPEFRFNH